MKKNKMYNKPWKQRKPKIKLKKLSSIPYINIKGDENFIFLLNDDWCLEDAAKFLKIFGEVYPNVNYCMFPYDMFKTMPQITNEEYTILNNILKKYKNQVEDSHKKYLDEIIDEIYANEQQCDFCIFDDECPHGMRCYGGNPIEPPCCNGYERCFDEDKYWEYKENK